MKAAALSLAGINTGSLNKYQESIYELTAKLGVRLVVLPAHAALYLYCSTGNLREASGYSEALKLYREHCDRWNKPYLDLHASLARELSIYLVAGTTLHNKGGRCYHTAFCFDPGGDVCGIQRQTHLSREERELGLSRGTELNLIDLDEMKMGLVIGNDARHPEVGRILALQGADILAHSGALPAGSNRIQMQLAGMWAQVQQNECWAVEAQLNARIRGSEFGARCAVIGPCVASEDLSGYLALSPEGEEAAVAQFNQEDRFKARESFPVFRQLNPAAYAGLL